MVPSAHLLVAILVSVAVLAKATNQGSVYIVSVERTDAQPNALEASNLHVLSSVFGGSLEKAKESILYTYKNTVNGFSAKLTPEQAAELSKQPGVLAVTQQGVSHLHSEAGPQQGAVKSVSGKNGI